MAEKCESKFAHLLQPIRDLAANWDVNVAEELEDYLDELESIHFSLEDESVPMGLNFAEAALLIQGSASVYSKKVEYLHSLVYAAIEVIVEKRSARQRAAHCESGIAGGDSEFGAEEQFLTLDDVAEGELLPVNQYHHFNLPIKIRGSRVPNAGGPEIDLQEREAVAPPTSVRPPVSLSLLGHCPGPISTSKFQAYADRSGAILLDPSDAIEPPGVPDTRDTRAHQSREESINEEGDRALGVDDDDYAVLSPGAFHNDDFLPAQDCGHAGPSTSAAAQDMHVRISPGAKAEESEPFDDPYEPLELHAPGTLRDAPLKYRLPKKPTEPLKVENGFSSARLISAAPPNAVSLPEFADYLKQIQKAAAAKKRSALSRGAAASSGQAEVQDEEQGEEGYFEAGSDDGYEPAENPFSPVLGGDLPTFAEEELVTAAMPFQEMLAQGLQAMDGAAFATDLEERVCSWQQSIEPHLDSQDRRPVFDINLYGLRIMDTLAAKVGGREWATFGVVADRQENWEVARLFAAMLQLCNAGSLNVAKT